MRAFARSALRIAPWAAFGLGVCLARSASAQPDPFEDYERFKAGEPVTPAPAALAPLFRTAPSTWSIGLRSMIGFSRLTFERDGGASDGAASAFLFRLSPALQVFVLDRLEIGLSPGLLVRSGGNDVGDGATDGNMLIEATGHYFAPLTTRLSLVPGVGVGGYFGEGSRTTIAASDTGKTSRTTRTSDTAGLSLALQLGVAYQIDGHLQLRSGLSASAFFGWDSVAGRSGPLRSSATHIGIPIEVYYVF